MRHFRSGPRSSINSTKLNCSISDRKISGQSTNLSEGTLELDSHADTTLLGKHFLVFENTEEQCNVFPYNKDYDPIVIPIVHAKCAIDLADGNTYILVVHNALYIEDQEPSLLCPNQIRHHGVRADDCLKHLVNGGTSIHSLVVPTQGDQTVSLPLV